ncbi:MAG: hypothetical protein JXA60_01680 [Candidatus Coatesbacteria bacterium]|nr:hypothetical protein [Candidatus Coatesbacteria bacterium]
MSPVVIIGIWFAAGLTLCIYSFLYKDNVFYKIAEHVYVGSSAAYITVVAWYNIMVPQVIRPLFYGDVNTGQHSFILIIPTILGILMLTRFSSKYSWLSRIPMSIVFGMGAGMAITGVVQAFIIPQIKDTIANSPVIKIGAMKISTDRKDLLILLDNKDITPKGNEITVGNLTATQHMLIVKESAGKLIFAKPILVASGQTSEVAIEKDEVKVIKQADPKDMAKFPGRKNNFGFALSNSLFLNLDFILVFIGVLTTLFYFYFSTPHTGVVGKLAKVGIGFIMVSFGASFGFTVMARISLLIGRVQFLLVDWLHLIK